MCEDGEDCNSCLDDCIGKTTGNPSGRYCCGNGAFEPSGETAQNCPIDCSAGATMIQSNPAERTRGEIQRSIARAKEKRRKWKQIEGPFDVIPGYVKGITVKKYHE